VVIWKERRRNSLRVSFMVLSQNVSGRTLENHKELHSFTQIPCQNPIQQFTNAKLSDKTLSHVVLYVYLECLWKFVSKIIVCHIYRAVSTAIDHEIYAAVTSERFTTA